MTSRSTRSLTVLLLVAALSACGGDDDGGAAGTAGTMAGAGGEGGTAGTMAGTGGMAGSGGVGGEGGSNDDDAGMAGSGGDSGEGGSGGDSGVDSGVDAAMPIECDEGDQDNDDDGICEAACAESTCDNGTCNDLTGTATCECDAGWGGDACDTCAPGYRAAIVLINTPPVCELDTPATTNMRMWLDANHTDSVTAVGGRVIEWRSRAPAGAGGVSDGGNTDSRPSYLRPTPSAPRVVRFDGVDDRLEGVLDLRSTTYSIFVVAKAAATKAGEQFFMHGLGETNITRNMRFLARTNATSMRYRHAIPGGNDEVNLTPANTSETSLVEAHRAGTLIGHALSVTAAEGTESIVTEHGEFDERLNIFVGRQGGASLLGALEGDVSEILVFVPAIPANQRQPIRDYLNAKWSLSAD